MTRSGQQKEKHIKVSEFSQNNCTVGTAARTRPFSFDEIMLKRKNKKQSGDGNMLGETGNLLGKNLIEKVSDLVESNKTGNYDLNYPSEDFVKVEKKEVLAAIAEEKLLKGDSKESRKPEINSNITMKKYRHFDKDTGSKVDKEVHGKGKSSKWSGNDYEKESKRRHSRDHLVKELHADRSRGTAEKDRHDSEKESKRRRHSRDLSVRDKYEDRNRGTTEKGRYDVDKESERRNSRDLLGKDKHDEKNRGTTEKGSYDSEKESERRHLSDHLVKDKHEDRNRGTTEKGRYDSEKESDGRHSRDLSVKDKHEDKNKGSIEKGRYDSEKESAKRHPRNLLVTDRHAGRNRGTTEKETKGKHRVEVDDRSRNRNYSKKDDPYIWRETEFLGKNVKGESLVLRDEESKPKRRRSRSTEHVQDGGRSLSLSPRAHKRMSHEVREHTDLPAYSSKDRSGRSNSDFDRMRMPNNVLNTHHRRHSGSASRLGGYSPRKRRTESGVKTPSPTIRSPEKRSAGWDLPLAKAQPSSNGSVLSTLQSSIQTMASGPPEVSVMVPVTLNSGKATAGVVSTDASPRVDTSVDSIQLTQATRPSRRLYIENLPDSATKESIMEFLNNIILSSGVHHMQGTHPCISCSIQKEKNQALVEFLTAEVASAALSFDGRSFSGSILKIRRPKDFLDMITGVSKKSVAEVGSISNIVNDSPHKIFIGGISNAISSDVLMEIACAFGPLKAYHYEVNADRNEPSAFLEYADQAVTPKACAGLNGMRLGGQVITVVKAIQDASAMEYSGNPPSYEIPPHAKPLLEKPTQVLKLKNVIDPEYLLSISESELEEILEDIRLECIRFGTIKSVNMVKSSSLSTTPQTHEVVDDIVSDIDRVNLEIVDRKKETGGLDVVGHNDSVMDEVNLETDGMKKETGGLEDVDLHDFVMDGVNLDIYDMNKETGGLDVDLQDSVMNGVNLESDDMKKETSDLEDVDLHDSVMDGVNLEIDDTKKETGGSEGAEHHDSGEVSRAEHAKSCNEYEEVNPDMDGNSSNVEKQDRLELLDEERESKDGTEVEGPSMGKDKFVDNLVENQARQPGTNVTNPDLGNNQASPAAPVEKDMIVEDRTCQDSSAVLTETANQLNSLAYEVENRDDIVTDDTQNVVPRVENNTSVEEESKLEENKASSDLDHRSGRHTVPLTEDHDNKKQESELGDTFEPGCVLVEFKRAEAACMAAHCLHGRLYDQRIVTVEYVNLDLYRVKYP